MRKLIDKYGSPLYVYEEEKLEKNINALLEFAKDIENNLNIKVNMHYSTKANSNLALLKYIKKYGMKVDAMSPVELELVKLAGYNSKDILYVCNNITSKEMKIVNKENILICLDSISQVETFGKIFPNEDIMIRINPEVEGIGHSDKVITSGKKTKFGIWKNDFEELFEIINKYHLNIIGIHMHLGSSFLNKEIDHYLEGIDNGLKIINEYFPNTRIIDLGGGFGIDYLGNEKLDFNLLSNKLIPILKKYLNKKVEEIKFEPGRYVVANTSYILGTVASYKSVLNTNWIGTDIGMNILMRPVLYDSYHKIEVISNSKKKVIANFSGNVCESGDILGKDRKTVIPNVDDIVKIYDTGAYGYSMASIYTGRLRPAEIIIKKDQSIEVIRRREELKDLLELFK